MEEAAQLVPLVDDHACHSGEHVGKAQVGLVGRLDVGYVERLLRLFSR
jgi:hypothetical protein